MSRSQEPEVSDCGIRNMSIFRPMPRLGIIYMWNGQEGPGGAACVPGEYVSVFVAAG